MKKVKTAWKLFITFLKIGSFTFGGGLTMLPLIQYESVEKNHWVTEDEMLDYMAISQSLPGIVAINAATFVGNKVLGPVGAIAASAGMVVPAFFAILIILIFLGQLSDNLYVEKALTGVAAASVALILATAMKLGKNAIKTGSAAIIALLSFIIVGIFQLSAAFAVIMGGTMGFLLMKFGKAGKKK